MLNMYWLKHHVVNFEISFENGVPFDIWNLEFVCYLMLGIWNFSYLSPLSFGSRKSRRLSPKRLKPMTVKKIAIPGKVTSHQASRK
jgi:hypothetical protein